MLSKRFIHYDSAKQIFPPDTSIKVDMEEGGEIILLSLDGTITISVHTKINVVTIHSAAVVIERTTPVRTLASLPTLQQAFFTYPNS